MSHKFKPSYLFIVFALSQLFSFYSMQIQAAVVCRESTCRLTINAIEDFSKLASKVSIAGDDYRIVKVLYDTMNKQLYFINTQTYAYHFDFAQRHLHTFDLRKFNRNYEIPFLQRRFVMASLVLIPDFRTEEMRIVIELWSGDTLEAKGMEVLYRKVASQLKVAALTKRFYVHPLSRQQEQRYTRLEVPMIRTSDLFEGREYQPLNTGVAFGYLTLVKSDSKDCLDHTHIAVYEKVPNDLGLVGGVITAQFQTPLSHINVKSMNRGTVNMAWKNAINKLRDKDLFGKPVRLEVRAGKPIFTILDPSEAKRNIHDFWESKRPRIPLKLKSNADGNTAFFPFRHMFSQVPTRSVHSLMVANVGAKAANLGLLQTLLRKQASLSIAGVTTPDGIAIPFTFYDQFLQTKQLGLDDLHANIEMTPEQRIYKIAEAAGLLDEKSMPSWCSARPALAKIRAVIQQAKVSESLLMQLKPFIMGDLKGDKQAQESPIHRSRIFKIRLRSSTNSEDMETFNGAGLYNSTGLALYKKDADGIMQSEQPKTWKKIKKKLRDKIRFVYQSAWNDRAFSERSWYGVSGAEHFKVKVGIAIHKAFPRIDGDGIQGEMANGVAVSKNILSVKSNEENKIYINAQHYDLAVTNPPREADLIAVGEDPNRSYHTEETLVTSYLATDDFVVQPWRYWSYLQMTKSSIKDGESVLRDNSQIINDLKEMEMRRLAFSVQSLSDAMAAVYEKSPRSFAIDIEWKVFGPDRAMVIKQARPFVIAPSHHDNANAGFAMKQKHSSVVIGPKRR